MEEFNTIEEHVRGEVLTDMRLEAEREGLLQDVAEEDEFEGKCPFGHDMHGHDECFTCEKD